MMAVRYTPLDLNGSTATFTGRTGVIDAILGDVKAGRSVALFGERQIGKTLLLWMLRDIINGQVAIDKLIDETLKQKIPDLMPRGHNMKALFITLERGGTTEGALLDYFVTELQEVGLGFNARPAGKGKRGAAQKPESMRMFFRLLSRTLDATNQRLIILMDEMEGLKRQKNFDDLLSIVRSASSDYKNLKFVFTGSYMWQETLTRGKRPWTHLRKVYLKRIDERHAREYLVKPLAARLGQTELPDGLADHIISWSGCKPLLLQQVCSIVSTLRPEELSPINNLERRLLDDTQIESYIKDSVLFEEQLRDEQKKILRLLCRRPSSSKRVARRLQQEFDTAKMYLNGFDDFDTIQPQAHGWRVWLPVGFREKLGIRPNYCVNGKLIELYGRDYNDGAVSSLRMFWGVARWVLMISFVAAAIALYFYVNPRLVTHRTKFSGGDITFNFPSSVEEAEENLIVVYIETKPDAPPVESLKINFSGDDIKYSSNGNSLLTFTNIAPGTNQPLPITYKVISGDHGVLKSRLSVIGEPRAYEFETGLRSVALTKHGNLLTFVMGAIGIIFPGASGWVALFKVLFPNKAPARESGTGGGSNDGEGSQGNG
jgi:hypothetical protein